MGKSSDATFRHGGDVAVVRYVAHRLRAGISNDERPFLHACTLHGFLKVVVEEASPAYHRALVPSHDASREALKLPQPPPLRLALPRCTVPWATLLLPFDYATKVR